MKRTGVLSPKNAKKLSVPWRVGPGEAAWHWLSLKARRFLFLGFDFHDDERSRSWRAEDPLASPSGEGALRAATEGKGRQQQPDPDELDTPAVRAELKKGGFTRGESSFSMFDSAADRLVDWIARARYERLLGEDPRLSHYVQESFRGFHDAQRLAQSASSRAKLPAHVPNPWEFLETYASCSAWAEWVVPEKKRTPVEKALLEAVRGRGGVVPVRDLPRLLPGTEEVEIDRARYILANHLVLFHDVDPETLDIQLGFLASVRRDVGKHEVAPLAALTTPPGERFERPLLHDDAVLVLLEIARESPKVTQHGTLFKVAQTRTEGLLESVPGWLEKRFNMTRGRRLGWALEVLSRRRFVVVTDGRATLTAEARAFVAMPYARRVELIEEAETRERGDRAYFGIAATSVVARALPSQGHSLPSPTDADRAALREAVCKAFEPLEGGRYYQLAAFLETASRGPRCPLLRGHAPHEVLATVDDRIVPSLPDAFESASKRLLSALILRMLPMGGVAMGVVGTPEVPGPEDLAFALTARGRRYLGLASSGAEATAAPVLRAIVQPNFDVVVLDPDAETTAELALLCEAVGTGDHARTYRITRASIQRGAQAGVRAEDVLARLGRLSKTGVPDNVARAIRDWAGHIRHVTVGKELLIECGDADTMARVLADLGGKGEEVRFAVRVPASMQADLKVQLAKKGLVVSERRGTPSS